MKLQIAALLVLFGGSLSIMASGEPDGIPSKEDVSKERKEVGEAERQLAVAIEKRDTIALDKLLVREYFNVYEGDKSAMNKPQAIARCKAGLLKYLAIVKDSEVKPQDDLIVVEGWAKLIPNRPDDSVPAEQWVHVRRLWKKSGDQWLLTAQFRRLEGDDGKGEVD